KAWQGRPLASLALLRIHLAEPLLLGRLGQWGEPCDEGGVEDAQALAVGEMAVAMAGIFAAVALEPYRDIVGPAADEDQRDHDHERDQHVDRPFRDVHRALPSLHFQV